MRRREFFALLGGAAVAWPLAGGAQQPSKLYRLGYLSAARQPNQIEALQTALFELGYVEGKNLKVEYRFGGPQSERLDTFASELVELRPDAIPGHGCYFRREVSDHDDTDRDGACRQSSA
jgi:putative tryptophan/tyrosine transport system substrate-binding protein